MFREIINSIIINRGYTLRKVAVNCEISKQSLYSYVNGEPTIGLRTLERIFAFLGLSVTKDGVFYYTPDIRTAIKRAMQEQGVLVKDLCEAADIRQPNVTEYLQGRSFVRPLKAELMMQRLSLEIGDVEIPDKMPRLKVPKPAFKLGRELRAIIESKGTTPNAYAKEHGISTGNFARFIKEGVSIAPDRVQEIFHDLDIKITDGREKYSDIRTAIRNTIRDNGIRYAEVAKAANMGETMLSLYLNGKHDTSCRKIDAIFAFLGLKLK